VPDPSNMGLAKKIDLRQLGLAAISRSKALESGLPARPKRLGSGNGR